MTTAELSPTSRSTPCLGKESDLSWFEACCVIWAEDSVLLNFPGGLVIKTRYFHCRGHVVQSLIRELRSHMLIPHALGSRQNKTSKPMRHFVFVTAPSLPLSHPLGLTSRSCQWQQALSLSLSEGFLGVLSHLCIENWNCQRIKTPWKQPPGWLHEVGIYISQPAHARHGITDTDIQQLQGS